MKKILFCLLFVVLIMPIFSEGSDNEVTDDYTGASSYMRGDQFFSLNAGAIFPLFNALPSSDSEDKVRNMKTLNVGVSGGFKWGFFLVDNFSIGFNIYGYYAQTANRYLLMFPLTFTTSYFFKIDPIEIPIYIDLGVSLNSLDEYFRVTPIIKPGTGVYWIINEDWSVGVNFEYWFVPEIVFGDFSEQTSLANFCQINLSGIYHF